VLHLEGRTLTGAVVSRIRNARWSDRYLQTANLIIDGPVFLAGRPGAARALGELICARQERGLRTILCEGEPRDGSIGLLMDAVRPEHRATLTLRFPVGTGKRHFVKSLCRDLGIDLRNMAALLALEPWSYKVVLEAAEALLSCQDARSEAQDAPCGEAT
jgi:hypothetical protein